MCANGPVHIGSDGEVFVNRARELIGDISRGSKMTRRWRLISDGDLWEHFYNAAVAKGAHSVKLT